MRRLCGGSVRTPAFVAMDEAMPVDVITVVLVAGDVVARAIVLASGHNLSLYGTKTRWLDGTWLNGELIWLECGAVSGIGLPET